MRIISVIPVTRNPNHNNAMNSQRNRAFTLFELMIAVAIISVLAAIQIPALIGAKSAAQSTRCRNNLSQLQKAWQVYTDDNNGWMPLAIEGAPFGYLSGVGNSWVLGNPQFDTQTDNIQRGTLWKYLGDPQLYRCPTDQSTVRSAPSIRRTRSYSMQGYLNGKAVPPAVYYWQYGNLKGVESLVIHPTKLFGFIDVSEDSISGPDFTIYYDGTAPMVWDELPGERHFKGANLSFLDGHVEYRGWLFTPRVYLGGTPILNQLDYQDCRWLFGRTAKGQWVIANPGRVSFDPFKQSPF